MDWETEYRIQQRLAFRNLRLQQELKDAMQRIVALTKALDTVNQDARILARGLQGLWQVCLEQGLWDVDALSEIAQDNIIQSRIAQFENGHKYLDTHGEPTWTPPNSMTQS